MSCNTCRKCGWDFRLMTNDEKGIPVVLKQCEVNIHIDHSKTGAGTNKHRDINNDSYCQMIAA